MIFADIFTPFILGLLTPLGAVCVLPLYPGFLAYLASFAGKQTDRKTMLLLGLIVTSGIIAFMGILGLIFTTILEVSLTKVIGIISPVSFVILIIISLLLIFNIEIGGLLPKAHAPLFRNPLISAFTYGFFFGGIVVPCNPLFIAAFFARVASSMNFLSSMLGFISFGIGIGFPLIIFSAISSTWSSRIIRFLTLNKRIINLVSGLIMMVISLYYLIFVFNLFGG